MLHLKLNTLNPGSQVNHVKFRGGKNKYLAVNFHMAGSRKSLLIFIFRDTSSDLWLFFSIVMLVFGEASCRFLISVKGKTDN